MGSRVIQYRADQNHRPGALENAGYEIEKCGGFLGSLAADEQRELSSLLKFYAFPAGVILFSEAQLPEAIYFLFAGQVKLSVNSSDGKRFIVHIANPGAVLGLVTAFAFCAHEVTAETCNPCDVASVCRSDFRRFLDKYPQAFRAAAGELARAYNRACMRLRTLGVGFTVDAKMAGMLLEWSSTGRETDQGTEVQIALTHEEIGQCIGTSPQSVTRSLQELQQRGVIERRGSTLTILDRAALETCALVHYP
jgi:CRP/FNR family transcriptional regulator, cyclic AMP receptor protein